MKTATQIDDLQVLERILQERLQSEFPDIVPFQVLCAFKNEMLKILVEHPSDMEPDRYKTFSLLQQVVRSEQPQFALPVKMYLRVLGTHRPYVCHTFTINSPVKTENASSLQPTTAVVGTAPDAANLQTSVNEDALDAANLETSFNEDAADAANLETSFNEDTADNEDNIETIFNWAEITETDSIWAEALEKSRAKSVKNQSDDELTSQEPVEHPAATANDREQMFSEPETKVNEPPAAKRDPISFEDLRPLMPVLLAGTGVSLAVFLGSFYALTRPCVVGSCKEIPIAQQLNNKSINTLIQAQSTKDIVEAQHQLAEAIRILQTIPSWSSDRKQAQILITAYQSQSQMLDQALNGFQKANLASQKSQNPPYAVSDWIAIKQLWQEAIALMQRIPTQSNAYQLAQEKAKVYKANLDKVNQRLIGEQQANKLLEAAKEGGEVAKARQGVAQSLDDWQLVQTSWQASINRLVKIPKDTTAYAPAQQLLASYQPPMATMRQRIAQEKFASNTYKLSLRMADQAKNSQSINQWSQALSNWRSALSYVKQIPNDTFYYGKSQSLVSSYTDAIKQAEGRLQIAMRVQEATKGLNQTCSGVPQICNYSIISNVIKVRMTPAYADNIKQKALSARFSGDYNAQIGVVNNVLTLGETLKSISDNSRLRLEVYGPDGATIQTHNP